MTHMKKQMGFTETDSQGNSPKSAKKNAKSPDRRDNTKEKSKSRKSIQRK